MEPDYKWIAQDKDGSIWAYELRPEVRMPKNAFYAQGLSESKQIEEGKENPNWLYSLIDIEKEDYGIVDGILTRKPKAEVSRSELTDTELIDAIVEHRLSIGELAGGGGTLVWGCDGIDVTNKKGNIRKAIKKWLRKNT